MIFNIILICCSLLYICFCFYKGLKNVKHIESVCTEQIESEFDILKTKRFLFSKFYIVNLRFKYNDKEYAVRKGLFKTVNTDKLNIYINPLNPEECEIFRLKDRCSFK